MSSPLVLQRSRAEGLVLARHWVGSLTYRWGAGGLGPARPFPKLEADCSGFIAGVCGYHRKQPVAVFDDWGGYVSTGSMLADAAGDNDFFEPVDAPDAGDLVVYGPYGTSGEQTHAGHVGMVVTSWPGSWAGRPGSKDVFANAQVVHCAGPNGRSPGVVMTNALPWFKRLGKTNGTQFLRYKLWTR